MLLSASCIVTKKWMGTYERYYRLMQCGNKLIRLFIIFAKDKKDKKAEKEGEQNDEHEEDEDGEKDEEGKGTASRATTRSASRMEAER